MVKIVSTTHHREGETEPRELYRIKDDLVRSATVSFGYGLRLTDIHPNPCSTRDDTEQHFLLGAILRPGPPDGLYHARPAYPKCSHRGSISDITCRNNIQSSIQGARPAWGVQIRCGVLATWVSYPFLYALRYHGVEHP